MILVPVSSCQHKPCPRSCERFAGVCHQHDPRSGSLGERVSSEGRSTAAPDLQGALRAPGAPAPRVFPAAGGSGGFPGTRDAAPPARGRARCLLRHGRVPGGPGPRGSGWKRAFQGREEGDKPDRRQPPGLGAGGVAAAGPVLRLSVVTARGRTAAGWPPPPPRRRSEPLRLAEEVRHLSPRAAAAASGPAAGGGGGSGRVRRRGRGGRAAAEGRAAGGSAAAAATAPHPPPRCRRGCARRAVSVPPLPPPPPLPAMALRRRGGCCLLSGGRRQRPLCAEEARGQR